MRVTFDLISLASLIAAINFVYVGILSWLEGRSLLTARLFGLITISGAWWAFWVGLAFTEFSAAYPYLAQTSQLISGFFGPLIFLFTLSYVGILDQWHWRWSWVLVPGAFGTLSFLLIIVLEPPNYAEVLHAYVVKGEGFNAAAVAWWYKLLQLAHAGELLAYTLASIVIFLAVSRRQTVSRDRFEARLLALIYATLLCAIVLANVLFLIGFSRNWTRIAPILPLPFVLVLWGFVRRRVKTSEQLQKERQFLRTYLPPPAVDEMLSDQLLRHAAKKVDAAVLFSDLREFTTLSEQVDPVELVRWIDQYFSRMSDIVLDENGMVYQLVGDEVVAVFGLPKPLADPCTRAVNAAVRMQRELAAINCNSPIREGYDFRMGIGIHFGPMVAGTVGSEIRRTYAIFGDTVNATSRIEGLAKKWSSEILISGEVYSRVTPEIRESFESLGQHTLRGKREWVSLYGIKQPVSICQTRGEQATVSSKK